MKLRLTGKLAQKVGIVLTRGATERVPALFFEEWAANIFIARYQEYFLFTEAKTLFSVVLTARDVQDEFTFRKSFVKALAMATVDLIEGGGPEEMRIQEIAYVKTANDYLRRAQVDMIYHAQFKIEEGKNTFEINRIPHKSIDYAFPVDRFIAEVGVKLKSTGELWSFVPDSSESER